MKLEEWKTYRTRFLVQAKQLSTNLTFVDHLGRQHCGRKGDYLVESSDGVLSIAPRRIFEDIYVLMSAAEADNGGTPTGGTPIHEPKHNQRFEPLEIEEVKLSSSPATRQQRTEAATLHNNLLRTEPEEQARARGRKLPQPCRDRNGSTTRLGLM